VPILPDLVAVGFQITAETLGQIAGVTAAITEE
jgi:hypothetical protein